MASKSHISRKSQYVPTLCEHGHAGSCPEDHLCQIRLRGSGKYGDQWLTVTSVACWSSTDAWQRQVAPLKRRQGYETRIVRVADEDV